MVLLPQQDKSRWFGLFRVRSPLLTESILFIFLRILRCFTSPRVALPVLYIQTGMAPYDWSRVSPFGNLRIKACVPLPEAYRSLLRPSSPDDAKAFTVGCNWFYANATLGVYFTHLQKISYPKLSKNKSVRVAARSTPPRYSARKLFLHPLPSWPALRNPEGEDGGPRWI